jgi:Fic family protein
MNYNWQQSDWPDFNYDLGEMDDVLFSFGEETGLVTGMLNAMPEDLKMEAIIDLMVAEAIKTSEIEGEYISREDVVSSIRNNLNAGHKTDNIKDKNAQAMGSLMVNVRNTYAEPLTKETLFAWHEMVMVGSRNIQVGKWRSHEAPMQVVSGALGREIVHFEAPPSKQVPREMDRFLEWFNDTAPGGKLEIKRAPVRSAIAHLYFETIHPFEDGNGRIGRAIAEKALSQTIGRPVLLSLSRTIEADKRSYYKALENGQQSNNITPWVKYFLETTLRAQQQAKQLVDFILQRTKFFDRFKDQLNERQLKVIKRMFEAGIEGFQGGMNAKKYMAIAKASKATATRDLQSLAEMNAFMVEGGGRSTHYILNL